MTAQTAGKAAAAFQAERTKAVADLNRTLNGVHQRILTLRNRADVYPAERARLIQAERARAREAADAARERIAAAHAQAVAAVHATDTPPTADLQRRALLAQLAKSSLDGLSPTAAVGVVAAAVKRNPEEGRAFAELALAMHADRATPEQAAELRAMHRRTAPTETKVSTALERSLATWDTNRGLGFDHHVERALAGLGEAPTGWSPGDPLPDALATIDGPTQALRLWAEGAQRLEVHRFEVALAEQDGRPAPPDPFARPGTDAQAVADRAREVADSSPPKPEPVERLEGSPA